MQGEETGRNRWRRRMSGVLLLISFGVVLFFAAQRVRERMQPTPPLQIPPLAVETRVMAPASFELRRSYPGTVEAVRRSRPSSRISGTVTSVHHREGAAVDTGELLMVLDDAELRAEVQRLEAAVQRIQADLAFWRTQLKRDERLLQEKTISPKQRDESRRMVKTLDASLKESKAALAAGRLRLGWAEVRAPWAGVVQQLLVEEGDLATPGKPLLELVAKAPLKGVVSVPQRDMALLATGQPVKIEVAGVGGIVQGVVGALYPALDATSRNATFEVALPGGGTGLHPGMALEAEVTLRQIPAALILPLGAVLQRKTGAGVFVVESGRARWRSVETGPTSGGQVLIRAGVSAGDEVILTPDTRLQDGSAVRVTRGVAQ